MRTNIPDEEVALARLRLKQNPHIQEFLGPWIKPGFTRPVLGRNILLDVLSDFPMSGADDLTRQKIDELEFILARGKSGCENFRRIFRGGLADDPDTSNGQILDRLAEVEAFRWLAEKGFTSIRKLREEHVSNMDLAADFVGRGFGVEVTRLGIPTSPIKKVDPVAEIAIPVRSTEDTILFQEYIGSTASDKITLSISAAVEGKRRQVEAYCQRNPDDPVIVAVSTGRFVLSRRNVRGDAGVLPRTWRRSLEAAWQNLGGHLRDLLEFIVLLDGPNVAHYPKSLEG